MSDRAADLYAALLAADPDDADAILAALGAAIAHNAKRPDRAATVADLGAASIPTEAIQDAVGRSSAVVGIEPAAELRIAPAGDPDGAAPPPMPGGLALYWVWLPVRTARPDLAPSPDPARPGGVVEAVHRAWRTLPDPAGAQHPLSPLVDAWQRLSLVTVPVDRYPGGILPASLRDVRRDHGTLPLALDHATPLGPEPDRETVGYLLGMEPAPSVVPPVAWLTLYDLTGIGPMQTRGRGAPLAQRLFVELLTAVPRDGRKWTAAPPVTLRDLFAWCWPRWYDREADLMRGGYARNKHLPALVRALVELDNMRIVLPGDRAQLARRLIRVDDLPTAGTALDEAIPFRVRHLPGSDRGPMFGRAAARRWGLASAPAWRSTIRLAYLWDGAKGRNGGARIYATRPRVLRGPGGVILGADGRPLRDRRGAVVTDWSDRRAVILGADGKPAGDGNPPAWERNPAAERLPLLGPDDLVRLAYDDDLGTDRRKRLMRAREALADKEAAGEIVREPDGHGGERIVEARPMRDPDTWER